MFVTDHLKIHAEKMPNKPAVIFEGEILTYRELYNNSYKTAASLKNRFNQMENIQKNVAIFADNCLEYIEIFSAISMAGFTAVTLDPKWSNKELMAILEDIKPAGVFIHEHYIHRLTQILSSQQLISLNEQYKQFRQNDESFLLESQEKSGEHAFYIGFTSGTTGRPKGYIRSHRSWIKSFEGSKYEFQITKKEHIYVPGPLVHSLFLYAVIHGLYEGCTITLSKDFNLDLVDQTLHKGNISVLYAVPTMLEAIIENQTIYKSVEVILSAGAKWHPDSKRRAAACFPSASLYEFYGASETSFITVLDPEGNIKKPSSVGRPFYNVEISIRTENSEEAKLEEIGHLFVKSDLVFSGYVNNEQATKKILQNGWVNIGDLAYQDDEGYIFLVGRKKNMIISGGLNIYPEEVEAVLLTMDDVEEVAVFGMPDHYWGEKVTACVKWKENKERSIHELKEYCRSHLSRYKCPKEWIFIKKFPYTSSGKIARDKLQTLLKEEGVIL
ncbi:AMP-binding protein [Bacillus taeanensis]|uniref:AMP-binding protein n=1 Tax=Bacillus taeanensis TaxID=273032 RepID=UPI0015F11BC0|nr:AMP-binding protein [Bacillus taeanensis]